MIARATTTCSVLRGTTTNDYGDTVHTDTPVDGMTGIPFAILEQDRRVYLPAEGATRVIRAVSGRCPASVTLLKDDRLLDERTGRIYLVVSLHTVKTPFGALDTTVELSYTN